jgi:hypothetical protein
MIGDEIRDEHAGNNADAAEAGEGDRQTYCQ